MRSLHFQRAWSRFIRRHCSELWSHGYSRDIYNMKCGMELLVVSGPNCRGETAAYEVCTWLKSLSDQVFSGCRVTVGGVVAQI